MLEFPYNSAWRAPASRKQGYKKVAFPLITPPRGSLWSIFLVLKFLPDCSEISELVEILLYFIPGKLMEEREEHHNLPAILICPLYLPLVLTFIFSLSNVRHSRWNEYPVFFFFFFEGGLLCFPHFHPEVCLWPGHNWWVNFIPLVGLGDRLLVHTGLIRTNLGRVTRKKSSLPLGLLGE